VLAWGSKPNDLDIHLTTPNAACKVSYQNKVCRDARQNVQLDYDVTSGYGPETITMLKPMDGTYRFYVHMFTADLLDWTRSQAVVKVLHKRMSGALQIHTYEVSAANNYFTNAAFDPNGPRLSGQSPAARYWNVFALMHTEQRGVGISLVDTSDVFSPNGIISEASKALEPTPPPRPPPTPRPSDVPTRTPTRTPTDSPRHPETHPPTPTPTATPVDPPVSISGFVKSALNGQGMAGVQLTFSSGPNAGKSAVSGPDGSYTFRNLEAAPEGTLQASKTGLETWSATFSVGNRLPRFDVMVVPVMNPGQIRVVLAWGANPPDLDVRLVTPTGCQVWYGNLQCSSGQRVQLDADSTRGYGPETMTFNQVASGKYSYMVNKYTAGSPVAMKDSQAVVQVLRKADPNSPIDRARYNGRVNGQLEITTCKASEASSWTRTQGWNNPRVSAAEALWWNVFEYDTATAKVTPSAGSGCTTITIA